MTAAAVEERFLDVFPHRWRILKAGSGPYALCLHGAGGSADSFRPLMNRLSGELTLLAPDLPGHGGTRLGTTARSGLEAMAEDLMALTREFETPQLTIAHSAGAAICLAMDPELSPRGHVLINAALSSFSGFAGLLFPAMARGLSAAPFAADLLSARLRRGNQLEALLRSTGSNVDDQMLSRYGALAESAAHIKGTLRMMAAWDLGPLLKRLPEIRTPVLLIAGDGDKTVPISVSRQAQKALPNSVLRIHRGGHLLHEERPDTVAKDIRTFATEIGLGIVL